jgi:hypothetical protein
VVVRQVLRRKARKRRQVRSHTRRCPWSHRHIITARRARSHRACLLTPSAQPAVRRRPLAACGCTRSASRRVLSDLSNVASNDLTSAPLVGVRVEPTAEDVRSATGGCERRGAGGAIVNHAEARATVAHVASLVAAGVPPAAIAVASPYAAQVALLESMLAAADADTLSASETAEPGADRARGLSAVEVATVDALQGREAEALVLSLVRSNSRGAVGFLADPRRLNVAVTRARRHLALVCDPTTVGREPLLSSLLEHCEQRGRWLEGDADGDAAVGVIAPTTSQAAAAQIGGAARRP